MSSQELVGGDVGDDWIERALKDAGREHRANYLDDDGFTARVMARLPAAITLPVWRRPAIVVLWVLAAAVPVFALPGVVDDAFRRTVALLLTHRPGLIEAAALLGLFGAAMWTSVVYALRSD